MPTAAEATAQQGQLDAALRSGLESLDLQQTVTFTEYTKYTFAEDGYVFWVATGTTLTAKGSLHYGTDRVQQEDQTIGVNQFIFSAEEEITEFNAIDPTTMWVGAWSVAGGTVELQVAFSRRGSYYQQANVWHYVGDAVYPAMQAQLVASSADLPTGPIVSNSLPIWLAQNAYANVYPSFLVPDNAKAPYIVAHIEPSETKAVQSFPIFETPVSAGSNLYNLTSQQLMQDRVRLTLYGFTNQTAIQYFASLMEYSLNTDDFGFQNSPAIRDEKRTQVEIAAIAQKKTIEILASYYQSTADAIARRLILSAAVTTTVA